MWTCRIVADHEVKLKENEKRNEYLNFAGELKKQWNMRVTAIPVVIGAVSSVTKVLLKRLEDIEKRGRVETIQTTASLR